MKNIEGFLQNADLCVIGQDHWKFSKWKWAFLALNYTRNDPKHDMLQAKLFFTNWCNGFQSSHLTEQYKEWLFRNSRPQMFFKIVVLKNFANFTCVVSLFNKVLSYFTSHQCCKPTFWVNFKTHKKLFKKCNEAKTFLNHSIMLSIHKDKTDLISLVQESKYSPRI